MSATVSATANTTQIAEFVRVFRGQVTENYTSSVTFMKQLTVIAFSTIIYMKQIFPDENFTVEQFRGLKLKILKQKCRDKIAQFLSTGLTQAFEAFEKRYLKQLVLCFYEGDVATGYLIEYTKFEYNYESSDVSVESGGRGGAHSFSRLREVTETFIRSCLVAMQTAPRLPPEFDICMRLYYNDDAPEGYHPPGFESASDDLPTSSSGITIKLGTVVTPYHQLVAITHCRDKLDSSTEPNPTQNPPVITQSDDDFDHSSTDQSEINCECNKNDYHEDLQLLTCTVCGVKQHAVCYGHRAAPAPAQLPRHVCARCSDTDPALSPTDATLCTLSHIKRASLCIIRRALHWIGDREYLSAESLAAALKLSLSDVAKLLKLFERFQILAPLYDSDVTTPRKINKTRMKNTINNYFHKETTNNDDVVGRLLAETFSNDNRADPMGKVLTPMEKMSLRNDTTRAFVAEHTPPGNTTEDSTLKMYREAILSNQEFEEEMPLSGDHNPVKNLEKIGKKGAKRKIEQCKDQKPRGGIKRPKVGSNCL